MFPIPARVLFPALVSLISGLWALAEWRDREALGEPISAAEFDGDDYQAARLEAESRQRAAEARAERKLRLAEAREARLAAQAAAPADLDGDCD